MHFTSRTFKLGRELPKQRGALFYTYDAALRNTLTITRIVSPSRTKGILLPVADLGFPRGGGANSPGGAPTYDFAKFSKNCMKLKEFGPPGGGARPKFYYVDTPLITII